MSLYTQYALCYDVIIGKTQRYANAYLDLNDVILQRLSRISIASLYINFITFFLLIYFPFSLSLDVAVCVISGISNILHET